MITCYVNKQYRQNQILVLPVLHAHLAQLMQEQLTPNNKTQKVMAFTLHGLLTHLFMYSWLNYSYHWEWWNISTKHACSRAYSANCEQSHKNKYIHIFNWCWSWYKVSLQSGENNWNSFLNKHFHTDRVNHRPTNDPLSGSYRPLQAWFVRVMKVKLVPPHILTRKADIRTL